MPWLASSTPPVGIRLEADTYVDDIVVQLDDGSSAFIQAKASSGLGAPFKSAVSQWCEAVTAGQCTEADQLLLIVAEPTGTLRDLARHLRDFQAGVAPTLTASKSLNELRLEIANNGLDSPNTERVMRMAAIHFVDARLLGPEENQGGAWLDAAVVKAGHGLIAFKALRAAIRDDSAYRKSSNLDIWRDWLTQANIPLVSDQEGLLAARLQAEDDALSSYREGLAQDSNMLPLADFNYGLASLHVPGLASGLEAIYTGGTTDSEQERQDEKRLLEITRREGRMLLIGRPGAGKSVALRLISSQWAATPQAPVPVRARLADLARKIPTGGPNRLKLSTVISVAIGEENRTLTEALTRRLQRGEALLLLDGLDEVQENRDGIIEAVANILQELPESIDLVISSRHSSSEAASTLGLPMFELNEPKDLDATLDLLLQKLAEVKGTQTSGWIEARQAFIEKSRKSDRALWEVPLLATLMILLLAERSPYSMPASRAELLVDIIEASVHRWESRRTTTSIPGIEASLTAEVLLDCYDDIAHCISQGNGNWDDSVAAVELRIREYWGKSPGEARFAAKGVLNHWDVTAGVFLTAQPQGRLSARTRLFAEIGEARWAIRDDEIAVTWLQDAISDPELRESVRLAAGLSPTVMRLLCDLAIERGEDLLDLALSAIEDGGPVDIVRGHSIKEAQISRISTLPLTPKPPNIGKFRFPSHSAAATLAVRLAHISLDEDERRRLITQTKRLGIWQSAVIEAIAATEQADRSGSILTNIGLDTVERALLDPSQEDEAENRRPAGLDELVKVALRMLVPTRPNTAERVAATAYRCSMSTLSHAETELKKLGLGEAIKTARPERSREMAERTRKALRALNDFDRDDPFLLLSNISDEPIALTPMQAWHLDEAAALIQRIDINYARIGDVQHAIEEFPTVTLSLCCSIAEASRIDHRAAAAEIKSLQSENPNHPDWWILAVPSRRRPKPDISQPAGSPDLLLSALTANNEWLARLALQLAWNTVGMAENWRDQLMHIIPNLHAEVRHLAGIIIAKHWPETNVPGGDAAVRSGFAAAAAIRAVDQENIEDAIPLLRDPDLLVREEAANILKEMAEDKKGPLIEALSYPAKQWTCLHCDQVMGTETSACRNHHTRPNPSVSD